MKHELKRGAVQANGLEFHYLEQGEGPLALLLHGFPDSAMTWRHLMPVLAAKGYRAVAPYMRGYAPTTAPDMSALDAVGLFVGLGADANALHAALGGTEESVVIGHDWGAVATYSAALQGPALWKRVVTMAVPPLKVLARRHSSFAQLKRSFYMWFFQMAAAGEVVAADDFAFLRELWADWSPGYDAREDLAEVGRCLGDRAHLSAALGYYRAFFDPAGFTFAYGEGAGPLSQPLLYLHGARDGCIGLDQDAMAEALACAGPGSRALLVPETGHFLHLESPEFVSKQIIEFIG
ncbi:Soluble epoxide hydrolase [Azoarcus sp. Aa7]|nr:Soluble epoxide hydrolase [Azoarcus sp. Aa7]